MRKAHILRTLVATSLGALVVTGIPAQNAFAATGDVDTYLHQDSGSNQYAVAVDSADFTIASAITMEAWVKPDATCIAAVECEILNKEDSYAMSIYSGQFSYALKAGSWSWQQTGIAAVAGVWQHVALTRAAATATTNFYLNGRLVSTGNANGAGTSGLADSIYNFIVAGRTGQVAGINAGASSYFSGDMDEIKVWQTERTQAQVQSDMTTYGPTNDTNLKLYYDFNDVSGSTISNKASGATSTTQLTLKNSPTFTNLESTTVINGNTKVSTFARTYLSANGWTVPIGISSIDAMVIGGGGGGGNNIGGGGSGGGGYMITGAPTSSGSVIPIRVGFGGAGGRYSAANTKTYDGTTLMNGQDGDSSTVTINGSTYIGGGGPGGPTFWTTMYCGSSGMQTNWAPYGPYVGSGGTGRSGGAGGAPSTTQSVANGSGGYTFDITGSSVTYGSGGGAGAGSPYVMGYGGDGSIGGNGGNPGGNGTNLRGAGGGGGNTSCSVGGIGGSGVVVLRYNAYSGDFTTGKGASFVYRASNALTVTTTAAGKVTFYAKGKVIPGCKNISTVTSTTITATCTWKPSIHTPTLITAILTPTASPSNPVNLSAGYITVTARTGKR